MIALRKTLGSVDIGLIIGLVSLVLVGSLAYLFPTAKIPDPGGKYEVGVEIIELDDNSRIDPFSDGEMTRRLVIDIWYPSDDTSGKRRSPWFRSHSLL